MIEAASIGNAQQLSFYLKDLVPTIMLNLMSPLSAPYLLKVYTDLWKIVFDHRNCILGELISYVTLRLKNPRCDIDSAWKEEPLEKAMVRTIKLIHKKVTSQKEKDLALDFPQRYLTAPAFCYTFPLLKLSLLSSYAKKDENLLHDGLQIISELAKLRGQSNESFYDFYHPRFLPRCEMFSLLIALISMFFTSFWVFMRIILLIAFR